MRFILFKRDPIFSGVNIFTKFPSKNLFVYANLDFDLLIELIIIIDLDSFVNFQVHLRGIINYRNMTIIIIQVHCMDNRQRTQSYINRLF